MDYPYGPYADRFSETQHKYGPYGPIKAFRTSWQAKEEMQANDLSLPALN